MGRWATCLRIVVKRLHVTSERWPIMHEIFHIYAYCAVVIALYVTFLFGVSRLLGNRDDLADVGWAKGFMLIALVSAAISAYHHTFSVAARVVLILVCVWGTRLAWHIWQRFV